MVVTFSLGGLLGEMIDTPAGFGSEKEGRQGPPYRSLLLSLAGPFSLVWNTQGRPWRRLQPLAFRFQSAISRLASMSRGSWGKKKKA